MAGRGAFGIPGAFVGELARIANQERPYWDGTRPIEQRGSFAPAASYDDGSVRPAVPNFVLDGFRALEGAGRNTYPESFTADGPQDVVNAGAYQDAARGFAGNMPIIGGGALATASGATKGALGIFGGRMAKTADQAALSRAEQLAEAGTPREQIWNETGWFQGPDKKWRFEIDDSGAHWNPAIAKAGLDTGSALSTHKSAHGAYPELSEYLVHKDLYDAYPGAKKLQLKPQKSGEDLGTRGSLDGATMRLNVLLGDEGMRSTALHEGQHAVQSGEGFAIGYNPNEAAKDIADARFREMEYGQKSTRMQNAHSDEARHYVAKAGQGDADAQAFVKQAQEKWFARLGKQSESNPYGVGPLEAVAYELTDTDDVFRSIHSEYIKALKTARMSPDDLYRAYAGETEARAVQARKDLTPEQRRARAPWLDYDVPEADQIVRFGSNGPAFE